MIRESTSTGGATRQLFAGLLARDEFSEREAHVGFVEHALHELREEHRHLAELALEPAAREQPFRQAQGPESAEGREEDVEILLHAYFLATTKPALASRHLEMDDAILHFLRLRANRE